MQLKRQILETHSAMIPNTVSSPFLCYLLKYNSIALMFIIKISRVSEVDTKN